MNILVIGNGFDLAHELPTRYTDFLFFCSAVTRIINESRIRDKIPQNDENISIWLNNNDEFLIPNMKIDKDYYISEFMHWEYEVTERNKKIYNEILDDFIVKYFWEKDKESKIIKEIVYLVFDNFWIKYFLRCAMHGNENWIDFEAEISKIILSIDADMQGKNLEDQIDELSNEYLTENYLYQGIDSVFEDMNGNRMGKQNISFKNLRDILHRDLNRLIRALEIYLTEYVEKIEIQNMSLDIEMLEIDKVLSFNYTDTFSKLYRIAKDTEEDDIDSFDYIHGKADINNSIKTNNMVLGIDEYFPNDRKNKEVEFIAFKKFYQRIHKQTGCKYKEWVDKIRQDYLDHLQKVETANYKELQYIPDTMQRLFNQHAMSAIKREKCQMHHVYIFGHSLDITDKDILRDLILNDNVYTTIFYHNKDVMGQQIANLVQVIEQDELIRRTGGSTKTIEFKQQKPMESIEDQGTN